MFHLMEETIKDLTKGWWIFILRGILAIIFGVLVVAWPNAGIYTLVVLFGAFVLVEGISLLAFGATYKGQGISRGWAIFSGILSIVVGIITFVWPNITAVALLLVIAIWALFAGIAQLAFAFIIPAGAGNKILLGLGGAFSIAFAIFLMARPNLGALAVVWIIGLFAVMIGIYSIDFGASLKSLQTEVDKLGAPVKQH